MQVYLHGIRCIFAPDKHPLAHAADVGVDLLRNAARQRISVSIYDQRGCWRNRQTVHCVSLGKESQHGLTSKRRKGALV